MTQEQQTTLKEWAQAAWKIRKEKEKAALKHWKTLKQRMSEYKQVIPAWIMSLHGVVENIKPDSKPFDVVIVDDADQTGPEGLLLHTLAKKIIVVGENRQISPETAGIENDTMENLKKQYLNEIKHSDYIGCKYSYYDYCNVLFKSHIQMKETDS